MMGAAGPSDAGREGTGMDMIPQGYPLIVTIDEAQHLVVGWSRTDADALAPVTVALGGQGRPQVHDDEFEYTLPPAVH